MKSKSILLATLILASVYASANDAAKYVGRWALEFEGGMGWLEVRQENEYLDADLLWISGSVTPVANVFVADNKLIVTRTSEIVLEDGNGGRIHTITSTLELRGTETNLIGTYTIPERTGIGARVYYVTAKKIPPLPAAPDLSNIKYGEPIDLLENGMDGWRLVETEAANGWKIEKGVLSNNPVQKNQNEHIRYGNLRTNDEFEDFNLKLSVNVPAGNNSGVYLRGMYEIQVVDSYGKAVDSHNMGALYSRITPMEAAEKKAGKWQKMDITLYDRHLTVILNGKKIIDNHPVFGVTGGAMTSNEFIPGPLMLQGDHGEVLYKDIVLTPILK